MIAPNSPRLAAKAVIAPATMPGNASGKVMLTRRSHHAGAQSLGRLVQAFVDTFERQADRAHLKGKGDDRRRESRAGPAEDETDTEMVEAATRRDLRACRNIVSSRKPIATGGSTSGT